MILVVLRMCDPSRAIRIQMNDSVRGVDPIFTKQLGVCPRIQTEGKNLKHLESNWDHWSNYLAPRSNFRSFCFAILITGTGS
jgi:hypothetical protein